MGSPDWVRPAEANLPFDELQSVGTLITSVKSLLPYEVKSPSRVPSCPIHESCTCSRGGDYTRRARPGLGNWGHLGSLPTAGLMFDPSLDSLCLADTSVIAGQGTPGGPEQGTRKIPVHPEGRRRRFKCSTPGFGK